MQEKREVKEKKNSPVRILVTAVVVVLFVRFGLRLFLPFVLAYLLAELITPAVRFLKKYLHLPVALSGVVLILLALGILGVLLFFLGRMLLFQAAEFSKNFAVYRSMFFDCTHGFCCMVDGWFCLADGTSEQFFLQNFLGTEQRIRSSAMSSLPGKITEILRFFASFFAEAVVTFAAAVLLLSYRERREKKGEHDPLFEKIDRIRGRLLAAGAAYLKTELILSGLIALFCSIGFFFVKREYAVFLGILTAVLDALPVLGSGCVLVPWSLISVISGDYLSAGILIAVYVACILVREFLEPRLLGNKIGIPPLYTLMAVYLGVKLFGVAGVILGPLCLILIRCELDAAAAGSGKEKKSR